MDNTKNFLLKRLFILSFALLLIIGFEIPASYSLAFSRYFPDDTVYEIHEFESGFHGGAEGAWGANDQVLIMKETFTFMSDGTFTGSCTKEDELNRQIGDDSEGNNTFSTTFTSGSGTESGIYSISSDGTITITFDPGTPDEESGAGILSEDGQTFIFVNSEFSDSEKWGSLCIGMGVKKGSGFSQYFPDDTVYEIHEFESAFHGGAVGSWGVNDKVLIMKETFTFMSDGTFTGSCTKEDELNRQIGDDLEGNNTFSTTFTSGSGTESGIYSISSDGTITITFDPGTPDEESGAGILSEDGQTFIFVNSEFNDSEKWGSQCIGMGVKKGSGFSQYFPDDTVYEIHEFESAFHGGAVGSWGVNDKVLIMKETFTFMSDGTFTGSCTKEDELNRQIGDDLEGNNTFSTTFTSGSGTESGIYSISSDGTITITFDPGTPDEESGAGILSEDGQTFIFVNSEFNDSEKWGSQCIGMGVKRVALNNGVLSSILLLLLGD